MKVGIYIKIKNVESSKAFCHINSPNADIRDKWTKEIQEGWTVS